MNPDTRPPDGREMPDRAPPQPATDPGTADRDERLASERTAPRAPSPAASLAALAGLVIGSGLTAFFIVGDPFKLFGDRRTDAPVGRPYLAGAAGAPDGPGHADHDHARDPETGLWTCGMHPEVVLEEPGRCPICGMDLVPLRAGAAGSRVLFYRHPMDPTVTSPVPAKDEMGMDYLPVYAGEDGAIGATVRIDPGVAQNMNVRTARVERRDLVHPIRTVGSLEYDQERMVTVTTKYTGWVERVHVNHVGEAVREGQPLFDVYAPELVQTEQELLSAKRFADQLADGPEDSRRRAESLVEAARTRLGYWDVAPEQIARLEASGEVFRTLSVVAPAGGIVMKRLNGLEGMAVQPGMEIFHIADLSSLWLSAEVFEDQLAWVREGTPAEITMSYFPGRTFRGTVRFIEPELSEQTRTLRVKIEVLNERGELRKGMFATVVFQPLAIADATVVPSEAILRTGQRNVVVVALGDGRFAPREVTVGQEAGGLSQVLDGVVAGEEVVVSSQFLLDSESKLRTAIQQMVAGATAPAAATDAPGGR